MPPQRSDEAFGYRSAPAGAECLVTILSSDSPTRVWPAAPGFYRPPGRGEGGRGQLHSQSLLKNPLGTGQILDLQSRFFVFARNFWEIPGISILLGRSRSILLGWSRSILLGWSRSMLSGRSRSMLLRFPHKTTFWKKSSPPWGQVY